MDKDTNAVIANALRARTREGINQTARGTLTNGAEYIGVILRPQIEDALVPNFTAFTDLEIATARNECELPKSLTRAVMNGLRPNTTDSEADEATDQIADYLLDHEIQNMRPDHAFVTVLQLAKGIDQLKVKKHGGYTPANRANHLAHGTFGKIIEFLPKDDEAMLTCEAVTNCVDLLRSVNSDYYGWFYAKAVYYKTLMQHYNRNEAQITSEAHLFAGQIISPNKSIEITSLFTSAQQFKNYGIKQVSTDSLRGGVLDLDEPIVSSDSVSNVGRTLQPVLLVSQFDGNKYVPVEKGIKEEVYGTLGKFTAVTLTRPAKQSLLLANDGELYLDGACTISLRDMYNGMNQVALYEITRAEVIAHYVDQIILAKFVTGNQTGVPNVRGIPVDEVVNKLILPRINRVQSMTQQTIDAAEAEESKDSSNIIIREHDVTYHTRRLLPHQRPSEKALNLAAKHSIKLPEGKTFVQAHKRGNGPRVAGHFVTSKTLSDII